MVGRSPRDLRAGDHRDVDYRAILRLRSECSGRKAIGLCYQRGAAWVHRGEARPWPARSWQRCGPGPSCLCCAEADRPVPVLASFPVWPLLAASVPRSAGLLVPSRPEPTSGNFPHSCRWQALFRRRGPRLEWRTSLSRGARAPPGWRPGPVRGRRGRQGRWLARPRCPEPGRGYHDHAEPAAVDIPAVGADVHPGELITAQLPQVLAMRDASHDSQIWPCPPRAAGRQSASRPRSGHPPPQHGRMRNSMATRPRLRAMISTLIRVLPPQPCKIPDGAEIASLEPACIADDRH